MHFIQRVFYLYVITYDSDILLLNEQAMRKANLEDRQFVLEVKDTMSCRSGIPVNIRLWVLGLTGQRDIVLKI